MGEAAAVAGIGGVLPFGAHDFGLADEFGWVGEADFYGCADVDVDVAGAEEAVLAYVFGHSEDIEVGAVGGFTRDSNGHAELHAGFTAAFFAAASQKF